MNQNDLPARGPQLTDAQRTVIRIMPITVLSLGLFTLVINATLFKLTSALVPGFHVGGFWTALGGAIVYSGLTLFITIFLFPPPGGPNITFHYRRF